MNWQQFAKDANADMVWKKGEVDITRTREQVLTKLAQDPNINGNWLKEEAYKYGIDFDEDTKDEFNRTNEE
jgi:hypothetical protein